MLRTSLVVLSICMGLSNTGLAQAPHAPIAEERVGIEKLHQQDIAATIANDPKLLCALWTADAVRLEPGREPDVGREAICARDAKAIASLPPAKRTYRPEIHAVQVVGDTAYEWMIFDTSSEGPSDPEPRRLRGKGLRVLQRQPNGSWRFRRVIWNVSRTDSSGRPTGSPW